MNKFINKHALNAFGYNTLNLTVHRYKLANARTKHCSVSFSSLMSLTLQPSPFLLCMLWDTAWQQPSKCSRIWLWCFSVVWSKSLCLRLKKRVFWYRYFFFHTLVLFPFSLVAQKCCHHGVNWKIANQTSRLLGLNTEWQATMNFFFFRDRQAA